MTEGFFDAPAETRGGLTRYLAMVYHLALACKRLSFRPMRDTFAHTMWRPVGPVLAEISPVSVVSDRGVMGSVVTRAETLTSEFGEIWMLSTSLLPVALTGFTGGDEVENANDWCRSTSLRGGGQRVRTRSHALGM